VDGIEYKMRRRNTIASSFCIPIKIVLQAEAILIKRKDNGAASRKGRMACVGRKGVMNVPVRRAH
jgi:hypothetical protein